MLTEIYIEALLVDEELVGQVWEAWDKGEIDDQIAWFAWWLIHVRGSSPITVARRPLPGANSFSEYLAQGLGMG